MKKVILLCSTFISIYINAQENLLSILSNDNEPIYISYSFKGTKIVNGQSVELPAKGVLQFNIQHRFGTLNSGLYNMYGLDFSQVRLSFDYGIKDWLAVSIGRSSSLKIIDSNSKIRLKKQIKAGFPLTIVLNSGATLKQWTANESSNEEFLFANQLSYTNQILIASKLTRNLTLQISPTIVHYNLVEIDNGFNDMYSLGIGGRHKISNRISVNAEYFYQLNGKVNNDVLSFGFDIETGGHIFQLHLSNSSAMIEPEFINNTSGKWLDGDIYFGFNISRVFTINY
jgi:hypothetical protein